MVHLLVLVTAVLVSPFIPPVTVFLLTAYLLDTWMSRWDR
jgi:hypothetical protein